MCLKIFNANWYYWDILIKTGRKNFVKRKRFYIFSMQMNVIILISTFSLSTSIQRRIQPWGVYAPVNEISRSIYPPSKLAPDEIQIVCFSGGRFFFALCLWWKFFTIDLVLKSYFYLYSTPARLKKHSTYILYLTYS